LRRLKQSDHTVCAKRQYFTADPMAISQRNMRFALQKLFPWLLFAARDQSVACVMTHAHNESRTFCCTHHALRFAAISDV